MYHSSSNPFLAQPQHANPAWRPPNAQTQQAPPYVAYPHAQQMPYASSHLNPLTNPFAPPRRSVFAPPPAEFLHFDTPSASSSDLSYGHDAPRYRPSGPASHQQPFDSASGYMAEQTPAYKAFSLTTTGWTEDDKLEMSRMNFAEWDGHLRDTLGMHSGALRWLDPKHEAPSMLHNPRAYTVWHDNDTAVRAFLSRVCAPTEREYIRACGSAAEAYNTLLIRHTRRGPLTKIKQLKEMFSIKYGSNPAKHDATSLRLKLLNDAVFASGPIDPQAFLGCAMLAAMSNHPEIVKGLLSVPGLDVEAIKDALAIQNEFPAADNNIPHAYATTAKEFCTTPRCKYPGSHTWPFCTAQGGGMAGKTVEAARAAQDAARGGAPAKQKQSRCRRKPRSARISRRTRQAART
ncbi:hypothetical protein B0H17DRAFT_718999 [Mycena rosella]|uniref:Uncharacterized protein n=1 Tax=Mycena rosella TaxID=1033263 RepID=A0AAD7B6L8_MYCRO|nr:hypothetical protein B0H17DRAFT_718999 [Mycena rosella]